MTPTWRGSRVALAFASGLLAFAATKGGYIIVAPWAQSAVIAGITIGLIAPNLLESGLIGTAVAIAGSLLPPTNLYRAFSILTAPNSVWACVGSVVVCGVVSACVTRVSYGRPQTGRIFVGLALALVIANLWLSPLTLNASSTMVLAGGTRLPALNAQLEGQIPAVNAQGDPALFFHVYEGVKLGRPFYAEYSNVLLAARGAPGSIVDFREPTLFWLWSLMPRPQDVVILFLLLSSASILSLVPISKGAAKLPLVIPAAAALAAYFMFFLVATRLFQIDAWAGAVGVLALAAMAVSTTSPRWRIWTCTAVALTVLSLLIREVTAFVLLAGIVSAWVGERSQRFFRVAAWVAGSIVFAVLYAVHIRAAQPLIVTVGGVPRAGNGSFGFMLAALRYGSLFLGSAGWLTYALAVIGIAGCFAVKDVRLRLFVVVSTAAPLLAFLFIGNNARSMNIAGQVTYTNYWGTAVVPILYALLPVGLGLLYHVSTVLEGSLRTGYTRSLPQQLSRPK